ncbi:unnamed protein product, partial [Owenia fusiformis]
HNNDITVQNEKNQGPTFTVEKYLDQNNSLNHNGGRVQEGGCSDRKVKSPDEPENNKGEDGMKVLVNQQWVKTLRTLPQLLVIIILLLMIGGVETNPGPQTNANLEDSRTETATHSKTESLEDFVMKYGLKTVENDGSGDCLFHALSHQLAYIDHKLAYIDHKLAYIDHKDLRKKLVKYVKDHPLLPNKEHVTTQFDDHIIDDWKQY